MAEELLSQSRQVRLGLIGRGLERVELNTCMTVWVWLRLIRLVKQNKYIVTVFDFCDICHFLLFFLRYVSNILFNVVAFPTLVKSLFSYNRCLVIFAHISQQITSVLHYTSLHFKFHYTLLQFFFFFFLFFFFFFFFFSSI